MWGWIDVLHGAARRQVFWRDVGPGLSIVPSNVEWAVVCSCPDHSLFNRRLRDCVKRAVKLFTGDVTSDRFAARTLATIGSRCEVRRDPFPCQPLVSCPMHILR